MDIIDPLIDHCVFCNEPVIMMEINLDGIVMMMCPKCNHIVEEE